MALISLTYVGRRSYDIYGGKGGISDGVWWWGVVAAVAPVEKMATVKMVMLVKTVAAVKAVVAFFE